MLADTSFFIDLMEPAAEGHDAALQAKDRLAAEGLVVYMAVSSRFELFTGTERFHDPPEARRQVQRLLDAFPTLPMTPQAADLAGKIHGRLYKDGEPIGVVDALIAGTALHFDEPVITRNIDEYERVQGLLVEAY